MLLVFVFNKLPRTSKRFNIELPATLINYQQVHPAIPRSYYLYEIRPSAPGTPCSAGLGASKRLRSTALRGRVLNDAQRPASHLLAMLRLTPPLRGDVSSAKKVVGHKDAAFCGCCARRAIGRFAQSVEALLQRAQHRRARPAGEAQRPLAEVDLAEGFEHEDVSPREGKPAG